jgi:hypothetical protein
MTLISYAPFNHASVWTEVGPVYVHNYEHNTVTTDDRHRGIFVRCILACPCESSAQACESRERLAAENGKLPPRTGTDRCDGRSLGVVGGPIGHPRRFRHLA